MKKPLSTIIGDLADLPGESLPGEPVVELYGDNRVLIENHRGILEYGTQKIQIKVKYGAVCVTGSRLRLCRMQQRLLVITGCIHQVQLVRGRA